MNADSSRLDGLPVEILRRIASIGNCEAVLALSKVNKALRAVCNDPFVYKALIENRNGYGGPEWPHHLPLSMQSPLSSWARYALADSLASHDNASNLKLTSILSWAPQLLIYHHPLINLADASRLVDAVDTNQMGDMESTYALAFCLALRLLSKEPTSVLYWQLQNEPVQNGLMESTLTTWSTPWARTRRVLMQYLKQPLQSPADASRCFTACSPAKLVDKRIRALMAVGVFSVVLRETIEKGYIGRQSAIFQHPATIAVPTSTDIPFHLMMDVPLPFTSGAITKLGSCHLAKMTTVDFLEEGEWAGFYSMSFSALHNPSISFDPPMNGIFFTATANHDDPTAIQLHATGQDAVGAFDLDGRLAPGTGDILLRKVYSGGFPAWDWACSMTPVGIVGTWGDEHYGGWIWLWKTGWTADHHV